MVSFQSKVNKFQLLQNLDTHKLQWESVGMRVFIAVLVLIFSLHLHAKAEDKFNYSLFMEEDGDGIMFLFYINPKQIFGQIVQYGGYKWFRLTYSNPDTQTSSFLQPSNLGVSGDADSWMIPRYAVDKMEYQYSEDEGDQYLTFLSTAAAQEIIGYLNRNESFSLSTLADNAWYAGTFIPIKSLKDFEKFAAHNARTFCMTLDYEYIEDQIFQELKKTTKQIIKDLEYNGLSCDKNFNLN